MTYGNGMYIHQYVTLNQANQYLAMNDQEHALSDLYHVLLHNGSTHEGFENLVIPWSRLVRASCPPPHAWAAAKTSLFIRNCMVREFGGEGGLDMKKRGLHLFSLVSPAWTKSGNKIEIKDAVTEMGRISATMIFSKSGAEVEIKPAFHSEPAHIALTVPYFVDLKKAEADGKKVSVKDGIIYLAPDAKKVVLKWKEKKGIHKDTYQDILKMYRSEYGYIKDRNRFRTEEPPKPRLTAEEEKHPAEPISFDLARRAFTHEYKRRFDEEIKAGKKLIPVVAPAMVNGRHYASTQLPGYPPSKAFDGNSKDLTSSWQTDPYPAWLRIDLEKKKEIKAVRVYPYWGSGRYYRYTVAVSEDGVKWSIVGDKSTNTTPSTAKGDRFEFEKRMARYVRVNMLYHNLNKGVHIVEVVVE